MVAEKVGDLEDMGNESGAVVQHRLLRLAKHTLHLWTSRRPARIKVAGSWQGAEDDLAVRGFSTVTGGPLEYERSVRRAWAAFHSHKARVT